MGVPDRAILVGFRAPVGHPSEIMTGFTSVDRDDMRNKLLPSGVLVGSLLVMAMTVPAMATDGLGDAVESLLAHVPENHRDACRPDLRHDDVDALMSVTCDLPNGITVVYTQLDSEEAVADRYTSRLEIASVDWDTGDCSGELPGEESYSIGGEPAGRLVCYDSYGTDSFHWTHDASSIYSQALLEGDPDALWSWWASESGPIEPAADVVPTGVGAALDALLLNIPEGHRSTCLPFDGGGPEDGVVVSVKCEVADDLTVYYSQHDTEASLMADYQAQLDSVEVDDDAGDCSVALPGEMAYTIGGEPAGRLVCSEFFDSRWFAWTHEPTLISATASSERTLADTWDWWLNESGPVE